MRPTLVLLASLLALSGCTAAPSLPTEALDRDTGATVTWPVKPLLFWPSPVVEPVRQFSSITLVAVDVNQNSRHETLLLAYFWISPQLQNQPIPGTLRIVGDDQVIELEPDARSARDAGIGTLPHAPPKGFTLPPVVYRCEPNAWRLLASAQQLGIQVGAAGNPWPGYQIWNDGRLALRQMLEQLQP